MATRRVLMLSWEYPPRVIGGLARVVEELSQALSQLSWEVDVLTADHPGAAEHEIATGIKLHRVKTQTDPTPDFLTWVHRLNIGMLQYAIKLHQERPFSLVHAHDWMVADAAWVLKTGFDLPLVATIHATEHGRMHGLWTDLQRYIHQMEWRLTFEAWRVIVNSRHMLLALQNLFNLPADKLVVIPNGTDPHKFDEQPDLASLRAQYASPENRIVLFVGRMVLEKGIQVLLEAIPHIEPAYPGTRFLLVGSGYYLEELKAQAAALDISQQVSFLGYVCDADLMRYYRIADAVVIPSLYEPFGIVALEAMAAGVPVVTSDAGGLTEFVEHMKTGITTYKGDASSLAWGILTLFRDPELADRLSQSARRKVEEVFNWPKIARTTEELYRRILEESQDAHRLRQRRDAAPVRAAEVVRPEV